jgi:hypothetical protein
MNRNLKWLATCALCLATPAIAGEVTGSGKDTPIRSGKASSICAFSGLNDDGLGPNSHIQNWGMMVRAFGGAGQVPFDGPGIECRGN